jgi:hypothetical protein
MSSEPLYPEVDANPSDGYLQVAGDQSYTDLAPTPGTGTVGAETFGEQSYADLSFVPNRGKPGGHDSTDLDEDEF